MRVLNRLSDLPPNAKIAIYGIGKAGKIFRGLLTRFRKDVEVKYYIDTYKKGMIDGVEIVSYKDISQLGNAVQLILIASFYWRDIENALKLCQFDNYMIVPEYFRSKILITALDQEPLCEEGLRKGNVFTEDDLVRYDDHFRRVKSLLAFKEDRILYDALIENRKVEPNMGVVFDHYLNNPVNYNNKYFEFIDVRPIKTAIEGGVSDGNFTKIFLYRLPVDCCIYGFEADYDSYLGSPIKQYLDNFPNVHIYPFALWSQRAKLDLLEGSSANVKPKEASESNSLRFVDGISIDDFVKVYKTPRIDFVKLHLEQSDLEALKGARNTITNHRPQIVVSICHKKEHLFEIPLYLDGILENYHYRLAHYYPTHADKYLYAIPNEISSPDFGKRSTH